MRAGRDIIARHGETVFNAARRLQGDAVHTPLTCRGFRQAEAMGDALRALLGPRPQLALWASPTGRALQTLAIVAERLELDWHAVRTDPRLAELEMGSWGGRTYDEIVAEVGSIVRPDGLLRAAPDGESYAALAARVSGWLADTDAPGDRLVIMHGLSSRVLRGVMTGAASDPRLGVPVAARLPQGSAVMIAGGVESVAHRGTGVQGDAAA